MKKIILYIVLLSIFNNTFSSSDITNGLKTIPDNFKNECYEYYSKIDNNLLSKGKTYYLNTNKKDLVIIQNNKILPKKILYKEDGIYNNYEIKNNSEYKFDYNILNDSNNKTFSEFTIGLNNKSSTELILKFNKELTPFTFGFNFSYNSDNYTTEYYISNDGNKYNKIQKQNITDFSIKYLKINFIPKNKYNTDLIEKIKIYELSFEKKLDGFLFMSFFDNSIDLYSKNNCKNNVNIYPNPFSGFSTDSNTKTININLEKNPDYDVFIKKDIDNDGINDITDNCINIYNPFQKDSNGDGRGDLCSDDDNDGIIGIKDNCINIYNPNQKDININKVGDICEFDKDKDGIYDQLDNCINFSNPDQKDTDNDGIGNKCDNSEYYNPRQLDKNNNGIGDISEEKEKILKQNDIDSDGVIDYKDNCKEIANPNQEDSDNDGIGNICDNSEYYNPKQLDKNNNGIGDISEDSDNDGIEGIKDNCINTPNSDQKDTDNDGIGDLCEDDDNDTILAINDNCPYIYNLDQSDIDNDSIGDKCDETDNRYIESNSTFFIGLIIFITLIFAGGIVFMVKKLK